MISVSEALDIILSYSVNLEQMSVPLSECQGHILAQEIYADRDFPPFDRVTMDGIAIRFDAYKSGKREFPVSGRCMAGMPQATLEELGGCLEVMTGAILPRGTDTVIRYEDVEISEGKAQLLIETINENQNVHRQGTDRNQGERLLTAGALITPAEIGVLATVGINEVMVRKPPSIAIISTGDELVDVDRQPKAHQIRKSNVYNLDACLKEFHGPVELYHIADDREKTIFEIGKIADHFKVLILSGGVSKGKADYVPEALEELGFQKHFHRIAQRPGKPFWFGSKGKERFVFAFPGNPVSTFVCYQKYFKPWIQTCLGLKSQKQQYACLDGDVHFKPDLTYFLQADIYSDAESGKLNARPVEGHGSGDLANLLDSNAFIELPPGKDIFEAGEVYPIIPFKS